MYDSTKPRFSHGLHGVRDAFHVARLIAAGARSTNGIFLILGILDITLELGDPQLSTPVRLD